jgi:hypothetical protein
VVGEKNNWREYLVNKKKKNWRKYLIKKKKNFVGKYKKCPYFSIKYSL